MHATLRGMMMRLKHVVLLAGIVLFFAYLGDAFASEAGGGQHLNWTDFTYRTVAFLILVGILFKLLRKPLSGFLNARREEIQRLLDELDTKTAAAQQENAKVQTKLAALEQETKKIVEELIAEGEAEKQKIIEAAHRQAEYIQQQAQVAIQQEVKAARDSLKDEIAEMSVAAAEELLKKSMRPKDQDRLVNEFMSKVVEAK
ncbi:MAG: F0F1 ATP synthase subunit B [Desulfobacteraceae bacterium]|nr:F0F1 ATP synthase subunit B [Desulfobacteraceae bacterium]